MKNRAFFLLVLLALAANELTAQPPQSAVLPIAPELQVTNAWCWATVDSMILHHYQVPDIAHPYTPIPVAPLSCTVVAFTEGPLSQCWSQCANCAGVGGGTLQNQIQSLINYTTAAHNMFPASPVISGKYVHSPVNRIIVMSEITSNRPIVAGVSPIGHNPAMPSEHVVLIVGYQYLGPQFRIIVNDPFAPYAKIYQAVGGTAIGPGQYSVEINAFAQAMTWHESIVGIQ